jgi:hypothetical protein
MDFGIKDRLAGRDHVPVNRLDSVGKVRKHFTYGSAEMSGRREAIHLGRVVVNADIAQLGINEGESDRCRLIDAGETRVLSAHLFLRFGEGGALPDGRDGQILKVTGKQAYQYIVEPDVK